MAGWVGAREPPPCGRGRPGRRDRGRGGRERRRRGRARLRARRGLEARLHGRGRHCLARQRPPRRQPRLRRARRRTGPGPPHAGGRRGPMPGGAGRRTGPVRVVVHDYAGRVLVARAERASMVVVGSGSPGSASHQFLGSVAEYCVRHSPVPVVIVPAPARGSNACGGQRPGGLSPSDRVRACRSRDYGRGVADHGHVAEYQLRALLDGQPHHRRRSRPRHVLRRIVGSAVELVGATYGVLGVVGEDGSLEEFVRVGMDEDARHEHRPPARGQGTPRSGHRGAAGDPGRKPDDVRRVGRTSPPAPADAGLPRRPGPGARRGVGNLYLTASEAEPFTDQDEELARGAGRDGRGRHRERAAVRGGAGCARSGWRPPPRSPGGCSPATRAPCAWSPAQVHELAAADLTTVVVPATPSCWWRSPRGATRPASRTCGTPRPAPSASTCCSTGKPMRLVDAEDPDGRRRPHDLPRRRDRRRPGHGAAAARPRGGPRHAGRDARAAQPAVHAGRRRDGDDVRQPCVAGPGAGRGPPRPAAGAAPGGPGPDRPRPARPRDPAGVRRRAGGPGDRVQACATRRR